jgi:hypothetical protein
MTTMQAQVFQELDANGNVTQSYNADGTTNGNFNPNRRDSLGSNKEIPKGVWAWTVDRRFGDITPCELDTMPHLYQNSIYNTGRYGEYNSLGSNYTTRLSRIFIDRTPISEFYFVDGYDYMRKEPNQFHFINTLSPYTNISYDNCGNKQDGEDHIDAKFAVNANKRLGFGFDLDYYYARGYYQNQSQSHFRASLFGSYRGDKYQMHILASAYQHKTTENGGITNDNYITHPELYTEQYSESEIPTVLSKNWNRNKSQHLFLSHRYNIGFYRKVKMTDEEIKARQFAAASAKQHAKDKKDGNEDSEEAPKGRPNKNIVDKAPMGRPANAKIMGSEPVAGVPVDTSKMDSTRIKIDSAESLDSALAVHHEQDSLDALMKREYVPVTSFIHTLDINNYDRIYQAYKTPTDYYANTYYDLDNEGGYSGEGIYDQYKLTSIKNTFALALLEGFNKYMKAGLKGFISYENRSYQMPFLESGATAYHLDRHTEYDLTVGGLLSKTQGHTFHFNVGAEIGLAGADPGKMDLHFSTDLNFPLFGDTVRLAAKAQFTRKTPYYFLENYHSKHLWWEHSLNAETRTHVEGIFSYDKTRTTVRAAIDEIQNYTYFGMSYDYSESGRTALTGGVYQEATNINVLTLQVKQDFTLGPLNWDNIVTYQNASMKSVLPLPTLNLFSNLYLKFKIAKVLTVELGGSLTYFTAYEAPDYLPQISQFAIQSNGASSVRIGGYPFCDVYANMHLKRARFFIAMNHVNASSGSKDYFLTPHYPTNSRIMRVGVSWNFYN